MNNLKLKLFEFKKALSVEQHDVNMIAESCFNKIDSYSELEIAAHLKNNLQQFKFYENVNKFMDEIDSHISEDNLLYELKDVYSKLDRKNFSALYRHPLMVLLEIINTTDTDHRLNRIVNELSQYDWVDEIKTFMWKFNAKPEERMKFSKNGGIAEDVFTVIAKVDEGTLTFVKDKWFLISNESIKNVLLETYIKDETELRSYRLLEEAVKHGYYENSKICFELDENLVLGVSTKNDGKFFINNEELENDSTLETIFASSIVPLFNRNFYPIINETYNNIKKFVGLNIVKKVTNLLNPYLESYVFNFENNMYVYRCDKRYGTRLFQYENASALITDVMKDLELDLTDFFKEKVEADVKQLKDIENKSIKVNETLEEIENALLELSLVEEELSLVEGFSKIKSYLKRHLLLEEAKTLKIKRMDILNIQ